MILQLILIYNRYNITMNMVIIILITMILFWYYINK